MQITVEELLLPTLQRIAKDNGLTPEKYASNIVKTFLESQYRGEFMDEIKEVSIDKIAGMKSNLKINKK